MPLALTPPREFSDYLRANGVNNLSVGRVVVATSENYKTVVEQGISKFGLRAEIILNKGSLMVLPGGVDKGSGLRAACEHLQMPVSSFVAVGDAENDLPFLRAAGYGVAVANALPELKRIAHWMAPSGHGTGVRELIDRILRDDPP